MIMKKIISLALAISLCAGMVIGCAKEEEPAQAPTAEQAVANQGTPASEKSEEALVDAITVVDQIGREVTLKAPAQKIVSSYYISTALLMALEQTDKLVGIEMKGDTRGLYHAAAPELLDLPGIGSGKGIDVELTASLEPDVVVIPQKLKDSIPAFDALGIPVVVIDPETQDAFEACVTLMGDISGATDRSEQLLDYYDEKLNLVEDLTADITEYPTVYISAGSDYLSTCTSKMYQNELIAMAGGTNVSAELTDGYWATISAEQLLEWKPAYIFAVSYAEYTLDDIKNDALLADLSAIANDQVYTIPSSIEAWDYPTPSSILGVLYMTHMLHPDVLSRAEYVAEAQNFYQEFFGIEVTEAELGL